MAQGKTSTESVSTLKSVAGTSVDTLSTTASDDLFARTKNHATGFLQSLEWRTSKKFPTNAGPSKVGHEKQTDDSDSDSAYFSAHASLMHCNTDDPTARDYLAMVSSGSENEDYVLAPQEAVENKKSFYASSTNCGVWLKEVAKARRRQFGENEPSDEKTRRSQSSISLKLPNIEELVDGKWTALTEERNDDDVMWFPLDGRHEQESTRVSSFSGGLHLADVNVKCELLNKLVKLKSLPAKTEPNCHVYQSNSNSRLTFRVF